MNTSRRIEWLACARTIAIFLVILGHTFRDSMISSYGSCKLLFEFIYRFHMPLWFFLSGCTFGIHRQRYKNTELSGFVKAKSRTLLVPFAVYGSMIYIVFFAVSKIQSLGGMLEKSGYAMMPFFKYAALSLCGENPYSFHLWFLELLFLFSISAFLINKSDKKIADIFFAVLASAVIIWRVVFDNMPNVSYNWLITALMRNTPWYIAGVFVIEKTADKKESKKMLVVFALSAIYLVLRVMKFKPLLANTALRIIIQLVEYAAAFGMIMSVISASKALCRWKKGFFDFFGKKSFTIFLLHQPLCAFTGAMLYDKMQLPAFLVIVVCFALSVCVPLAAVWILKLLRLKKAGKLLLNIE